MSRDSPNGVGAPVSSNVGEELRGAGQQVTEQHRGSVERIVLRGADEGLPDAVPVERGAEDGFEKIPVRKMVGPLALSLKARCERVMSLRLLPITHLGQS